MNESPYDGQWRQLAWLLIARGARLIEYWHWNTLPFGTEMYWGGVLPHSGIPGRAYHEIARIGQELREAGGAFATAEPDYDIAVLYDSDSKFALSTQGPLRGDPFIDPDSYRHILAAFSRGIFDAARQQRLPRSGRGRAAGGCSRPGQTGLNQPSLGYGALGYGRRGRRRFRARVRLVVEVVAVLAAVGGIVMFRQQSTQPGAAVDFYTSAAPALVAIPVVIVVLRVYPWCCEACCAAPSADGVRPGSSAWSGPHGPRSPPRCRRSRWCSRSPWPPSPAWSGTR